jgi:hypothetical protein
MRARRWVRKGSRFDRWLLRSYWNRCLLMSVVVGVFGFVWTAVSTGDLLVAALAGLLVSVISALWLATAFALSRFAKRNAKLS